MGTCLPLHSEVVMKSPIQLGPLHKRKFALVLHPFKRPWRNNWVFFFCALLTATKGLSEGPGRVWQENIGKGLPALAYSFPLLIYVNGPWLPRGIITSGYVLGHHSILRLKFLEHLELAVRDWQEGGSLVQPVERTFLGLGMCFCVNRPHLTLGFFLGLGFCEQVPTKSRSCHQF